jgi:MEDS: MEthanogen/methylotroph, DcmR Sensory domain/Putative zinc-finger
MIAIPCEQVWREISNYLEGEVQAALRQQMEDHFRGCRRCSAVLDGTRNIVRLVGDGKAFDLPTGFSNRLYSKLSKHLERDSAGDVDTIRDIPVGITEDLVPLGSHLIYFWGSDADFARGVRFLHPGFGRGEHCVAFGHDEAIGRVLELLRSNGFDPDKLVQNRQLTVLRRHASAQVTLSDIGAVLQGAVRAGATAVRFLGNLGVGRDPLPAGEDDVVQLEAGADALISGFPCVIVCMYDVRTLPGRLILRGGLETHPLAVCADGVRKNPYYNPEQEFFSHLH